MSNRHLRLVPEEDLLLAKKRIAALEAQVQTLREALRAYEQAQQATDEEMELRERAICEGWDNDPTGASHIVSAIAKAATAWNTADKLRTAALAATHEHIYVWNDLVMRRFCDICGKEFPHE